MFGVYVNRLAGACKVRETRDDDGLYPSDFTRTSVHATEQEALAAVEAYREKTTVYCVFFNRPAWEGFVSKENATSGSYRGWKYGRGYNLCGEYRTEEEAKGKLREIYRSR